jgi:poly-gamma-glutamate synthesis protein (capsule biosynthesis protein)
LPVGAAIALLALLGGVLGAGWLDGRGDAAFRPEGPDRTVASPGPPSSGGDTTGPSPSPTPSPQPEPRRGALVIHGTGDVNVDPSYIPALASNGYAHAWSGLGGLFRRDDLTVINLECAVSTKGSPLPKTFTFRGDPAALGPMRRAGVEVANLGNNHAYDFGPGALVDTIRNLRGAGIAPVGAGRNQAEALEPALFELDGWTVAVVGLDQVVDPWPDAVATATEPGTAAGHDTGLMIRAIERAEQVADLTIVSIHWGVELDTQPRPEQIALGERMVDAGADVIFGHHSHRLQPVTRYRGRPIFWGLGNFVWPSLSVEGSTTAVAQVRVAPNGRITARLLPAIIESHGHPVLRGG